MKKSLKKITVLSTLAISLSISSLGSVAHANDEANFRAPVEKTIDGVKYLDGIPVIPDNYKELKDAELGTTPEFVPRKEGTLPPNVLRGINTWSKVSEANKYSGHDYDRYNNNTKGSVKITLKTTSSMTASISGQIEYGFSTFAQAQMQGTIGQTYSKEFIQEVTVKPYYVTELKSAKKTVEQNYRYTHTGWFGDTRYSASSLDHRGNEYWIYSNPIKK
ncbi:hypothetical protein [Paenibacillus arenosi]|uniref:Uncharacterized protein n=1 Tax=Paenibacillus arenosi TaxID=2774142 RepID=A0ABR9AVK9_9BACL|nr:hypothetical protein [Paenibacillus arenosi]MBD8498159.1 hypothetical protein [Paenibacillus arenosi]